MPQGERSCGRSARVTSCSPGNGAAVDDAGGAAPAASPAGAAAAEGAFVAAGAVLPCANAPWVKVRTATRAAAKTASRIEKREPRAICLCDGAARSLRIAEGSIPKDPADGARALCVIPRTRTSICRVNSTLSCNINATPFPPGAFAGRISCAVLEQKHMIFSSLAPPHGTPSSALNRQMRERSGNLVPSRLPPPALPPLTVLIYHWRVIRKSGNRFRPWGPKARQCPIDRRACGPKVPRSDRNPPAGRTSIASP